MPEQFVGFHETRKEKKMAVLGWRLLKPLKEKCMRRNVIRLVMVLCLLVGVNSVQLRAAGPFPPQLPQPPSAVK
jgi:hypothetical protein